MGAEGKSLNISSVVKEAAATASDGGGTSNGSGKDATSLIPSSSISIDISLPVPEMKPGIIELCKDLFGKWSSLDDSHFSIERVSGGITNLLLKVAVKETSSDYVFLTVRLYGPNTDLVIDRKRELQALPFISAAGFGAELLGLFANGMIQSFISARTLSPSDMSEPKISAEIACQLRKFHQVKVAGSTEPQLWSDIFKFLKKAEALEFDDKEKLAKYKAISFKEIRDELNALKNLTDRLDAPVVFAHNDLLSGNLMRNDEEEKLYLIDFEYGSYNYRGYDIANHFNEYAGYDCDYSLYPDRQAQYLFLRNYLEPERPHEADGKVVEALYVETNTFRLASHLYWALWAIIQAKVSPIDFDYLSYFFLRYDEYKKQKENCLSIANEYISTGSING
ncbi:hypothetical protein KFK09_020181 [Dendrobium nobile]|uniref:ethanolamine kinase n=1 Tax=Dendrobium nobile TaxID=94219 RepID=A0A8T3AT59_DENNO|nr:hypothetical protein KFK09_020181 [Dendrobium nobile]